MKPIQNIYEIFLYDDKEFINAAYLSLLRRNPDLDGMNYYLGRLRIGYSKQSIIMQIVDSDEFRREQQISGLDTLIRDEKESRHWFFGWFDHSHRHARMMREYFQNILRVSTQIEKATKEIRDVIEYNNKHQEVILLLYSQLNSVHKNNINPNHIQVESNFNSSVETDNETKSNFKFPLVSREEVIEAYNTLLGRSPESEFIIMEYTKACNKLDLIDSILNSREFKIRGKKTQQDNDEIPALKRHRPILEHLTLLAEKISTSVQIIEEDQL